ncbi:hypothetical protein H6G33_06425 [Calothrix sp. FACHB-1219]|uniref:hypothetical protein n=1 Tax=unclassified Calothrix TaxID=2619626 RepID=UPI0016895A4B|nr:MULTISPECIES: hypothetical protein [unclassified Calothrix]MBD2204458.1 hypothetical protein [Calothrix sp. FACHB-168]MBD2216663.1 hypothetical protein [Calothrix sp. FACHB-1219]
MIKRIQQVIVISVMAVIIAIGASNATSGAYGYGTGAFIDPNSTDYIETIAGGWNFVSVSNSSQRGKVIMMGMGGCPDYQIDLEKQQYLKAIGGCKYIVENQTEEEVSIHTMNH